MMAGHRCDAAVAADQDERPSVQFASNESAQGSVQLELSTIAHLPQVRDGTRPPGMPQTVISTTREGGYGDDETEQVWGEPVLGELVRRSHRLRASWPSGPGRISVGLG